MLEYYHADRLNYAVVGTPNRLEYDQGFFVKNGDGAADVKPIAHLYKTQVYAARRVSRRAGRDPLRAPPTTDTYSLPQTQEEFYFSLPYDEMDICLYARDHGLPAEAVAETRSACRPSRSSASTRTSSEAAHDAATCICPPQLVEPVALRCRVAVLAGIARTAGSRAGSRLPDSVWTHEPFDEGRRGRLQGGEMRKGRIAQLLGSLALLLLLTSTASAATFRLAGTRAPANMSAPAVAGTAKMATASPAAPGTGPAPSR